jgi:hypothetical protein
MAAYLVLRQEIDDVERPGNGGLRGPMLGAQYERRGPMPRDYR